MKTIGTFFIIVGCFLAGMQIYQNVVVNYKWENNYANHWSLADKSSTIPAKQQHVKDFVDALENGNKAGQFASYNAIIFQTPNNNFRANLTALETLAQRLEEIQGMDTKSFEYNTAIQQITAQEQGEAHALIYVLEGCYVLASYPLVWYWLGGIFIGLEVFLIIVGICFFLFPQTQRQFYF